MAKIIHLRCENCGSSMDINAERDILFCPYCGAKALIEESDEVKITKMNTDAVNRMTDVKLEKARLKLELKKEEGKEDQRTLIMMIAIFAFFIIMAFVLKAIGA